MNIAENGLTIVRLQKLQRRIVDEKNLTWFSTWARVRVELGDAERERAQREPALRKLYAAPGSLQAVNQQYAALRDKVKK